MDKYLEKKCTLILTVFSICLVVGFSSPVLADEDDVQSLLNKGEILLDLKKYGEALSRYQQVLKKSPEHLKANFTVAKLLIRWGRYQEARPYFNRLLAIEKKRRVTLPEEVHLERGTVLFHLGYWREARKSWKQYLDGKAGNKKNKAFARKALAQLKDIENDGPFFARQILDAGLEQTRQKNYGPAEKLFANAVKIGPEYGFAHYYYGRVLNQLGKYKLAQKHLARSRELGEYGPYLAYELALSQYHLGEYRKATAEINLAIREVRRPDQFVKVRDLSQANIRKLLEKLEGEKHFLEGVDKFQKGEFEASLGDFKQAEAILPPSSRLQFYLGVVNNILNRPKQALAYLKKSESLPQAPVDLAFELAVTHHKLGQIEKARKYFAQYTRLTSNQAKGQLASRYLVILKRRDRYDRGLQALEKGLGNLADGRYDEGKKKLIEAEKILPTYPHFTYLQARIYSGKKRYELAVKTLEPLLEVPGEKVPLDYYYQMYFSLMKLNREKEARKWEVKYRKAAGLPTIEEVEKKLNPPPPPVEKTPPSQKGEGRDGKGTTSAEKKSPSDGKKSVEKEPDLPKVEENPRLPNPKKKEDGSGPSGEKKQDKPSPGESPFSITGARNLAENNDDSPEDDGDKGKMRDKTDPKNKSGQADPNPKKSNPGPVDGKGKSDLVEKTKPKPKPKPVKKERPPLDPPKVDFFSYLKKAKDKYTSEIRKDLSAVEKRFRTFQTSLDSQGNHFQGVAFQGERDRFEKAERELDQSIAILNQRKARLQLETTLSDGSLIYKVASGTAIFRPEGRVVYRYPSYRIVIHSNGIWVIHYETGSKTTVYTSGRRYHKRVDGTRIVEDGFSGRKVIYKTDGTIVERNGNRIRTHMPQGTIITQDGRGKVTFRQANGSVSVRTEGGQNQKARREKGEGGEVIFKNPDGSVVTIKSDGTWKEVSSNGVERSRRADGIKVTEYTFPQVILMKKGGATSTRPVEVIQKLIRYPSGRLVIHHPSGKTNVPPQSNTVVGK